MRGSVKVNGVLRGDASERRERKERQWVYKGKF